MIILRALKVCSQFGYEVEFTGVGQPASGYQERFGFCSQIGVFRRLERGDDSNTLGGDDAEDVYSYKLVSILNVLDLLSCLTDLRMEELCLPIWISL